MKNIVQLGGLNPNSQQRSKVYSRNSFSPTLMCPGNGGGGTSLIPLVIGIIRYERNEYAKRIRSQYEKGIYPERRCNLREPGIRTDGCSNTISTVQKDNYLCIAEPKEEKTNTELSEKERSC